MNQHTATGFNTALNETVAFWEMLKQILIFHIVYFNGLVRKTLEQALLNWQLQHGENMGDSRLAQRLLAAESEQSGPVSDSIAGGARVR